MTAFETADVEDEEIGELVSIDVAKDGKVSLVVGHHDVGCGYYWRVQVPLTGADLAQLRDALDYLEAQP